MKVVTSHNTINFLELARLKRCRNYGRVLTSPVSIERGFGPTCGMEFAHLWIKKNPSYITPSISKKWTRAEVLEMLATRIRRD